MPKTPELKHFRTVVNGATTTVVAIENPDPELYVEVDTVAVEAIEDAPNDDPTETSDGATAETTADSEEGVDTSKDNV